MSILNEADSLVNGARLDTYEGTDDTIVALWSAYLGIELTVLDYAALMILLKVARTKDKFHRDSWVDIAGYAEIGPRLWSASQPVSQSFWDEIDTGFADLTVKIEEHTGNFLLYNPEPRVWESLNDVPVGVQVTDIDGDEWLGDGNEEVDVWTDKYAPFTEVLS